MQRAELVVRDDGFLYFNDLRIIIEQEIGIDPRTLKNYINVLKRWGWLVRVNRHQFKIGPKWVRADF
jgi:hypothetical protein